MVPIHMSGISAIQNALSGINRGIAGVNKDAAAIASNGPDVGAMVDAQQQLLSVEASAKALSITDQTLGTLIDVKA